MGGLSALLVLCHKAQPKHTTRQSNHSTQSVNKADHELPLPGHCSHNRPAGLCKECGGICEHNRFRSKCRDCLGGSIGKQKKKNSGGTSSVMGDAQHGRAPEAPITQAQTLTDEARRANHSARQPTHGHSRDQSSKQQECESNGLWGVEDEIVDQINKELDLLQRTR